VPQDITKIHIKPLRSDFHQRRGFRCSVEKIQNYCHNNIHKQNDAYQVRAFVACDGESPEIIGFYYLNLTSYEIGEIDDKADKKFQRVDAVPAVYLGMIAVHQDYVGSGIGQMLMVDALHRTAYIADQAGTYGLALDALDDTLTVYYRKFGFVPFKASEDGLEMFLPIGTIQEAIRAS
jgi:GNAT superfamily N-acetyltransferase